MRSAMMPRGQASLSIPVHREFSFGIAPVLQAQAGLVGRHGVGRGKDATRHSDASRVSHYPAHQYPCWRRTLGNGAELRLSKDVMNPEGTRAPGSRFRSAPQGDKGRKGGDAAGGTNQGELGGRS